MTCDLRLVSHQRKGQGPGKHPRALRLDSFIYDWRAYDTSVATWMEALLMRPLKNSVHFSEISVCFSV